MKKKKAKIPMSDEDEKLIGELITDIKKSEIGEKYVITDGVETKADVKYWISTTCWPLDKILGGGIPGGRIIEIYGPDGCGKCITKNSLVFTEKGIIPISLLSNERKIGKFKNIDGKIYDGNNFKNSKFYYDGIRNTIKIKTNHGYIIEGTPDHRILIYNGKNFEWKKLKEFEKNDLILIWKNQQIFNKSNINFDFNYHKNKCTSNLKDCPIPDRMTLKLAELIGYLVAEGHLMQKNHISFTNYNNNVLSKVKFLFKYLFDINATICNKKGNATNKLSDDSGQLRISSSKVWQFLKYLQMVKLSKNKEVPLSILQSGKKYQIRFLSSLWDCDGWIDYEYRRINFAFASKKLINQIQIMLLNFGIITSYNEKESIQKDFPYKKFNSYCLSMTGEDAIKFINLISDYIIIKKEKIKKLKKRIDSKEKSVEKSFCYLDKQFLMNLYNKIKELEGTDIHITSLHRNKGLMNILGRENYNHLYDSVYNRNGKISFYYLFQIYLKLINYVKNYEILDEIKNIKNIISFKEQIFFDYIEEISLGKQEVFDLYIQDSHRFIGNGFMNHNSSLGLAILSQAQKEKNVTIMNDTEHSYDSYRGTSAHNIVGKKLLYSEIISIEETFSMFEKVINEVKSRDVEKKIFFLWDSVAATSTLSELEGMYGDDYYGVHARKMSQGFRKIKKGRNMTLLLINQIRQKMGTYYPTYTTFGGWAVKFYPSMRLKMKVIEKIKSPGKDEYSGIKVEMFTKKNKVYPPFRKCNIIIDFKRGVDNVASCVDYFIEKDIIKKGKKEIKGTGKTKDMKGYYFLNGKNMRKIEMIKYFRENEDEMRELFFKKGAEIEE